MFLDINTAATVEHVNRLEMISKSALPVAVRQTLTSAAFDVKRVTMPFESNRFTKRKPTFFKANSKALPAQGFDVNAMMSTVGFLPIHLTDKSHAVQDLEQQEEGGDIEDRAFIPLKPARGGSYSKNVLDRYRLRNIMSKIVDSENSEGNSAPSRFIQAAKFAGIGGFVIGNQKTKSGGRILWQVVAIGGGANRAGILLTPLFSVKKAREVEPGQQYHHFMQTASLLSAAKMEKNFIAIAEKRILKVGNYILIYP